MINYGKQEQEKLLNIN